ncbi:MAG TPA: CRISPR-associated helicase Cas3' [Syntrophomonadaceae bacterium]|nr:CRISPR-associated helicase Cas3' [Syntrophomonadaceae bacterium]
MRCYAHRVEQKFYPLSAHLAWVAVGAAERLSSSPTRETLYSAALVAGLAHDFGKYTSYFQSYLRTGRGGAEKQHALISGLWGAYLARRLSLPPEQQLAIYFAVGRHHQDLGDPEESLVSPADLDGDWAELDCRTREQLRVVVAQIADLQQRREEITASLGTAGRWAARLLAARALPSPEWLRGDWGEVLADFLAGWKDVYRGFFGFWRRFKRQRLASEAAGSRCRDLGLYFGILSLFSALIDADKIHAARVSEPSRMPIPADAVERYRGAKYGPPATAVDALREDLYRCVAERIRQAPLEQRLFSLTAPTGSGKTLAALAAAFCLRERLAEERGTPPRIIYALPFTSIIDQAFAVGEDVLCTALQLPPDALPTSLILKHHHLADLSYLRSPGEAESPLDEALLLIESWQSEVVVTTFVQFFHTLVGYENRMLKKFHRLGGAVVLLDEVQNIPVEYWPLVEESLRQACSHLDMRVILMTATRPEWFEPEEVWELAGDPEAVRRRFAALNRVRLVVDTTPCTVEEAAAAFLEQHQRGMSYLVVLNTIRSSVVFYNILREALGSEVPLYYLSTNIVPAERQRRIAEIRESLASGEKPVVISTQVVEAGVDLDFDVVWRDLGPVDAVVQVAGRCNRHFRKKQGDVRLVHLVDRRGDEGLSLASYVYGRIHTFTARCLFSSCTYLEEPDFYELVAEYFSAVRQNKSAAESEAILRAMTALRFKSSAAGEGVACVSDFQLIRQLPYYNDIFICVDERAEGIWERYQKTVAKERDLRRRWAAFLEIKRDFHRYLVSVPNKLVVHRLPVDSRPLVIPAYLLDEFYDRETGFKRCEQEDALIF